MIFLTKKSASKLSLRKSLVLLNWCKMWTKPFIKFYRPRKFNLNHQVLPDVWSQQLSTTPIWILIWVGLIGWMSRSSKCLGTAKYRALSSASLLEETLNLKADRGYIRWVQGSNLMMCCIWYSLSLESDSLTYPCPV